MPGGDEGEHAFYFETAEQGECTIEMRLERMDGNEYNQNYSYTVNIESAATPTETAAKSANNADWVGLWRYVEGTDLDLFSLYADGTFQRDVCDLKLKACDVATGQYNVSDGKIAFTKVVYYRVPMDDFSYSFEISGDIAVIDGNSYSRIPEKDAASVLTDPFADYTAGNNKTLNSLEQYQDYIGVWYTDEDKENSLDIIKIDADSVQFELSSFRLFSISAAAKLTGNQIRFGEGVSYDYDGPEMSGTLAFFDGGILVTIDESKFEYVKAGADYKFTIKDAATAQTSDSSEEKAMNLLIDVISDVSSDRAVVFDREDTVNGEHCWLFDVGANTDDKFTAEEHYAVGESGQVYVMDILSGGEYIPVSGQDTATSGDTSLYYEPSDWNRKDGPNDVTASVLRQPGDNMPIFKIEAFSLQEVYGYDNAHQGFKMKWLTVTDSQTGKKVLDTALDNESFTMTAGLRFIDYTFDGYPDLCVQSYDDYGMSAYDPARDGSYLSYRLFVWDAVKAVFTENTSFSDIPAPAVDPNSQMVYSHHMELYNSTQTDYYTKYVLKNGVFTQTALLRVDMIPELDNGTNEKMVYTEYKSGSALPTITFNRTSHSDEIKDDAQKYYVPGSEWDLNSDKWLCTMSLESNEEENDFAPQ